jgi:hypothetical protein
MINESTKKITEEGEQEEEEEGEDESDADDAEEDQDTVASLAACIERCDLYNSGKAERRSSGPAQQKTRQPVFSFFLFFFFSGFFCETSGTCSTRVDWVADHARFEIIQRVVTRERSWRQAARTLQNPSVYGDAFKGINESTIRGYYDKLGKLKPEVFQRGKGAPKKLDNRGKRYIFEGKEELEQELRDLLGGMREAGTPIDSVVGISAIRSLVEIRCPELLGRYGLSRRWCRYWIRSRV